MLGGTYAAATSGEKPYIAQTFLSTLNGNVSIVFRLNINPKFSKEPVRINGYRTIEIDKVAKVWLTPELCFDMASCVLQLGAEILLSSIVAH